MKSRAFIPLIVGLGVSVLALKVFIGVLQKAKGNTAEIAQVVCATTDIEPTMEIQDSMIEVTEVPKSLAPSLAFSDKKDVVGRVTSLTVAKGMPIVPKLLTPKGTPPGMAVRIRDGYRAVAVQVDESAGVAGWIKPGCRVDVIVLMTVRRKTQSEKMSRVILQNVEVLAVGQDIGTKGDSAASLAKSVTLLVHPEDVSRLHLAATEGKVRLAMRNQLDYGEGASGMATGDDLWAFDGTNYNKSDKQRSPFLSRLFGGQPLQNEKQATDNKDREAMCAMPKPEPPVQVTRTNQPWLVKVVKGSKPVEEIWFENRARTAREAEPPPKPGEVAGDLATPTGPVQVRANARPPLFSQLSKTCPPQDGKKASKGTTK